MSTSLTFERGRAYAVLWQLAQVFWVGGLYVLQGVVAPAMSLTGLAPLLLDTLMQQAAWVLIQVAGLCIMLQLVLLGTAGGVQALLRDSRGQLLLAALAACLVYLGVTSGEAQAGRVQVFCYMLLAVCGVLLVVQPPPGVARA